MMAGTVLILLARHYAVQRPHNVLVLQLHHDLSLLQDLGQLSLVTRDHFNRHVIAVPAVFVAPSKRPSSQQYACANSSRKDW